MSDHRHQTDRKETTEIGGCPNGCNAYELEVEGTPEKVDKLLNDMAEAFDECSTCGEPIGRVKQEEPSEVLD